VIVDSSAILAILFNESDSPLFARAVSSSTVPPALSAGTYIEASIILDRNPSPLLGREFDRLLRSSRMEVVSVSAAQAVIARSAYRQFGRGSGNPAKLNFGDCFAYALAIDRNEPLLYKGDDFGHTDVRSALGQPPQRGRSR
jgi:ribonuclease VapC